MARELASGEGRGRGRRRPGGEGRETELAAHEVILFDAAGARGRRCETWRKENTPGFFFFSTSSVFS
jgi:hypothetical protein